MSFRVFVLLLVVIVTISVLFLDCNRDDSSVSRWPDTYRVQARFENVSGLKVGNAVAIAGVEIGQVTKIVYDSESYEVVVDFEIDSAQNDLPVDSSVSIYSYGLMGDKYLAIEPGGAQRFLVDGSEIQMTQSSMIFEQLIGQFIFNQSENGLK
jgi:phospholipid/cholesterol/gamma-HCH transport system substrate-binding protein